MKYVLALALAMTATFSFAADVAKGTFHYGKTKFQPADAIAYQEPGKDGKPVTIIAFSDFKIDRQGVLDAIQTVSAFINQLNQSQKGNFVFVRLTAPDRCGLGGLVDNGGQQIDLGDSFTSKASVGASRVAGDCYTTAPGKLFDDAYDFHLTYDLPLMAIPKPSTLAAGGGEAGQVYSALIKAIQTADWSVASLHLRQDEVRTPPPKAAEMKEYFYAIGLNYPKTVTVTGGLTKGPLANLDIKGIDHDGKKLRGVVMMKKTAGNWRVIEQSLFFDE
ncbi:MAG TPA: hypothetical protein VLV78_18735 [Thermoanaerobaculia bacterium]|nr:hypothetical protein [Thermoanaerobaculia bacterium]